MHIHQRVELDYVDYDELMHMYAVHISFVFCTAKLLQ